MTGGPRFVLASAAKDLRRRLADPPALVLWIGLPLVIGGLLSLLGGGDGGAAPTAHVLVVDRDSTFLSRLLLSPAGGGTGGGSGAGTAGFLELEPVGLEEGRARIDAGEATALLVLPAGFADAVTKGEPAELQLITNPAQRILPRVVERAVDMLVEAAFYAHAILGDELAVLATTPAGAGLPDRSVAAMATAINGKVSRLQGVLFPPVLTVRDSVPGGVGTGEAGGFGSVFLGGLLFMSILFIAQGMSDDLWEEREAGTLRRLLVSPRGAGAFLAGKLLAGAAITAAVALVGLALGVGAFDLNPARTPAALLWCTYAGTALLALFFLLQVLATSRRGASLASTLVVFPLIMIGGSFFPFRSMPDWMAAIGRWTPNGLAVLRLGELLFGRPDPTGLALSGIAIGLPAAAACWLVLRRLRGGFGTG